MSDGLLYPRQGVLDVVAGLGSLFNGSVIYLRVALEDLSPGRAESLEAARVLYETTMQAHRAAVPFLAQASDGQIEEAYRLLRPEATDGLDFSEALQIARNLANYFHARNMEFRPTPERHAIQIIPAGPRSRNPINAN